MTPEATQRAIVHLAGALHALGGPRYDVCVRFIESAAEECGASVEKLPQMAASVSTLQGEIIIALDSLRRGYVPCCHDETTGAVRCALFIARALAAEQRERAAKAA